MDAAADSQSPDRPIKVLYIAGPGRVGSTLLGRILGHIPHFAYVGELKVVFRRNLEQNQPCGCGLTVPECPVWSQVLQRAFPQSVDAARMSNFERRLNVKDHLLAMTAGQRRKFVAGQSEYREALGRLYAAVAHVNQARVIVDSSHVPLYGVLLENTPGLDVYVVHLTRDARAVAYSWQRRKVQPNPDRPWEMRRSHPLRTAMFWNMFNVTAERFFRSRPERYLLLRYEDFIARPRDTVEQIVRMLGEPTDALPFVSQHEVVMGPQHSVFGNPDRFKLGTVALHPDMEWQTSMKRGSRAWVNLASWPLLWRYGYYAAP